MSRESERLEHLISRYLDDECSAEERELLDNLVDHDPKTRALYDEYSELDHAIGVALQTAMDRRPARPSPYERGGRRRHVLQRWRPRRAWQQLPGCNRSWQRLV